MSEKNSYTEVKKRYEGLAESDCCLSCGGAAGYADIIPGEVCVDLGSGRGTDVIRMAEKAGPEGFAVGIDVTEAMLEKARITARKMGVENVRFVRAPLESLPFADLSVDLVISNCTINHAPDKETVWKEIYRILKHGGRFVVSDIYSTAPVPDTYAGDEKAVSECWAGAVTREKYFKQLAGAGFRNITIIEESKPYEKGKIEVASFTIAGIKKAACCCGS